MKCGWEPGPGQTNGTLSALRAHDTKCVQLDLRWPKAGTPAIVDVAQGRQRP